MKLNAPGPNPDFTSSTYCAKNHFVNEGFESYPGNYQFKDCSDFILDKEVTMLEIEWWKLAWAALEADRLAIKLTLITSPSDGAQTH